MKIMADNISYKKKPDNIGEFGKITNRLKVIESSFNEIFNWLLSGRSIRFAVVDESRFISQQIIAVDVDEKYTTEEMSLNKCKELGLNVSAIYKSFSYGSKDKPNAHRILFVLDREITNEDEMKQILEYLIDVLNGDKSCKNIKRFFLGTCNGSYYYNNLGIVKANELIERTREYLEKDIKNKGIVSKNTCKPTNKNKGTSYQIQDVIGMDPKEFLDRCDIYIDNVMKPCVFAEYQDIMDKFNNMKLNEIIEKEWCRCHKNCDNNPSASLFLKNNTGTGTHYYCFSCGLTLYPIDLFIKAKRECTGTNFDRSNFINYIITNKEIKVISKDLKEKNEIISKSINSTLSDMTSEKTYSIIKSKYPKLTALLRRIKTTVMAIIDYKYKSLFKYPLEVDGEHVFFMSLRSLMELDYVKDIKTTQYRIDDLTRIGLVKKIDDQKIPINFRERADDFYDIYKMEYTTQYFKIPVWTEELLMEAERKLNDQKGITRRAKTTKGYNAVGLGKEVRPKSTHKIKYTQEDEVKESVMTKWVEDTIKRKRYILKKDFIRSAKKKVKNINIDMLFMIVINKLKLKEKAVNNDLKCEYNLKSTININSRIYTR